MLYDTMDFLVNGRRCEENNFTVDTVGFNRMMEEQRQRARQVTKGKLLLVRNAFSRIVGFTPAVEFNGYERLNKSLLSWLSYRITAGA